MSVQKGIETVSPKQYNCSPQHPKSKIKCLDINFPALFLENPDEVVIFFMDEKKRELLFDS